jgi:hypothetical protein
VVYLQTVAVSLPGELEGDLPLSWKSICTALVFGLVPSVLMSQAMPTASRNLNIQVGGTFALANPGIASNATIVYGKWDFKGGGVYALLDPYSHFGLEVGARQVFGTEGVHERTYEVGPRFFTSFGHASPYAKVLFGRGVFNFPNSMANEAFNAGAFGGGGIIA